MPGIGAFDLRDDLAGRLAELYFGWVEDDVLRLATCVKFRACQVADFDAFYGPSVRAASSLQIVARLGERDIKATLACLRTFK